jgi:hypothetical protein
MTDKVHELGPCCACGAVGPSVRNVGMLHKKAPVPGHGWGCVVCDLPPDGALVVLCDACTERGAQLRWACRGWPGKDGRIPIDELAGCPRSTIKSRHSRELAGRQP